MSANKFSLKHNDIEIDYTIGITPSLPALTYTDRGGVRTFEANQITTEQTALGSLVSFPLEMTIDVGGVFFGFFLPRFDVTAGQPVKFKTAGVYDTFGGPNSVPPNQAAWRCIELHGVAESAIVPAVEPANT